MLRKYLISAAVCIILLVLFAMASLLQQGAGYKPYFNDVSNVPILDTLKTDSVIVFFAFAGCTDSCPPALRNLSNISTKITKSNLSLSVVVINLVPKMGANVFDAYVKGYNKHLIPYTPDHEQLVKLKNQFSVQSYTKFSNKNQVTHPANLYLTIKDNLNQWKIARIFPNGRMPNL